MIVQNKSDSHNIVNVCCLVSRNTAYILDKFLLNQKEIQESHPESRLILATEDVDLFPELKTRIKDLKLRAEAITYNVLKPEYAKSRLWSIACGREALRQYSLSLPGDLFLLLDSDMLYDRFVIPAMISQIGSRDVLFSGYQARIWNTFTYGAGCLLINRKVYQKIHFHCIEFGNGTVIQEDELFEVDAFQKGARIKKGVFVACRHYRDAANYNAISPGPVKWLRVLTTQPLVRYLSIKFETLIRYRLVARIYSKLLNKPF
jgi:hypothetical protein